MLQTHQMEPHSSKPLFAHPYFQPEEGEHCDGKPLTNVDKLVHEILRDLRLRGVGSGRRFTFAARIRAIAELLAQTGPEERKASCLLTAGQRRDAVKHLPESGRLNNKKFLRLCKKVSLARMPM